MHVGAAVIANSKICTEEFFFTFFLLAIAAKLTRSELCNKVLVLGSDSKLDPEISVLGSGWALLFRAKPDKVYYSAHKFGLLLSQQIWSNSFRVYRASR